VLHALVTNYIDLVQWRCQTQSLAKHLTSFASLYFDKFESAHCLAGIN
jgi:hypothetical protein